jgi:hypothetical protein
MGFHLPRVFSLPAMSEPNARTPLTYLSCLNTEVNEQAVPQSLNEQEDWLSSLEATYPSKVLVLVFYSPTKTTQKRQYENSLGSR